MFVNISLFIQSITHFFVRNYINDTYKHGIFYILILIRRRENANYIAEPDRR